MKKRMIVWMLVISILIPMVFASSVHAAESDSYMVPSYGIYQNFMDISFPDAFNNRLYLATLDACSDLNNLIDKASWVIGEDLSIERCTEILANMVTLMNYQLEDAIVEQASVDTTKTLLDYGMDLADIAAGAVGASSLKASSDAVTKRITAAIGITNGVMDFTANTIEDLEFLVQLEGDYSMQYDFLETVYMYADIPEMKEAAQLLILANKEIMRYKIETITSVGESFAKFEATDVFLDQVAGELLEDSDFWGSDAYGPLMVLSEVYSNFSLFKLTLDIGLFLGDSLFGTSDIYNRYNEMFAIRDIHNSLLSRVKANPALNEEDYENMDRNISLMKMTLYVDARGEYCAYQMTTEGKLSELFSSANEENIEKNYNTSINIIENTFASLDGLYVEEEWDRNPSGNSILVTDAYAETEADCIFRIPQINLSVGDVAQINEEIYNELYPVVEASVNEITELGFPCTSDEVLYYWAANEDILSLVIKNHSWPDASPRYKYMVYNVSVSTGMEMANTELIETAGLTEAEFYERAKEAIGSAFWDGWDPSNGNFSSQMFLDMFNECLDKSVTDENIGEGFLYMNEQGQLCLIAKQYSFAGPAYTWCDVNLIEYELSPYYEA